MVLGIKSRVKETKTDPRLVRIFDALGDNTRFKLVRLMASKEELCVF